MQILDLPSELIDNILYYSILSRDLPRALRLKLVCKTFYVAFRPVLYNTKVLDDAPSIEAFRKWHYRKHHGADTLWHDYISLRCRNERDESIGRYVEVRNTAIAFLRHREAQGDHDLDLDAILDRLCWLLLECGGTWQGGWQWWSRRGNQLANPGLSLLSVATCFGAVSLVRDLLSQGHDPTDDNCIFPCAMYVATWTGQADMLQLLQEYLPDFEEPDATRSWDWFRSKIGVGSLPGAAIRGDIDLVKLALYPPSRRVSPPDLDDESERLGLEQGGDSGMETIPNSDLVRGEKPGSVLPMSKLGYYIALGMRRTRSPEIYQYLQTFLNPAEMDPCRKDRDLAGKAAEGDIVMVRHLLDIGADPASKHTEKGMALVHAVRACHEDVVDLLLERGVDPNQTGSYRCGTILTAAARAGSMAMLRKLLDAGTKIEAFNADTWTLRHAVKVEHTPMVELLLDMGIGSEKGRRRVLKMAQDTGLESMVDLLKSRGVTMEEKAVSPVET